MILTSFSLLRRRLLASKPKKDGCTSFLDFIVAYHMNIWAPKALSLLGTERVSMKGWIGLSISRKKGWVFPNAPVFHLERLKSDNRSLFLSLQSVENRKGFGGFFT